MIPNQIFLFFLAIAPGEELELEELEEEEEEEDEEDDEPNSSPSSLDYAFSTYWGRVYFLMG